MEERTDVISNFLNSNTVGRELNFLNSPSDILRALVACKAEGTSIGIQSTALGSETIVTSVEDIIFEEGQTIVVLKHYDTSGYILPSHKLNIEQIEAVYPFSTPFVNPYINNISKDKTWFF
jgi:hypothetical protein